MIRVGVFPAGTEIGLEINNALKYVKDIELVGITSAKDHSAFVYKRLVTNAPFLGEDGLIDFLAKAVIKEKIDYIFPSGDEASMVLSENEEKLGATVVMAGVEASRICCFKSLTFEALEGIDFLPDIYSSKELSKINYPVFIKPDRGQGSVGAKRIENEKELTTIANLNEYIICEYLPGKEFTVDCISNQNTRVMFVGMRQRERIKSGISVASSNIPLPDRVKDFAQQIASRLKLMGAWFFQLKEDGAGKLKLMEVATRIAGTMGMYRNKGINFPLISLCIARGFDIDLVDNRFDLAVDRALVSRYATSLEYKKVYIDLDDTLILGKEINAEMMRFLYQCQNKRVDLILITRHVSDVEKTLNTFKIHLGLFKKIIHLQSNDKKSEFMDSNSSIFIDDSFGERLEVSSKLGIPVFDLDSIELLIDWKR